MSKRVISLVSILYYLAFAVTGIIAYFAIPDFLGQSLLVNFGGLCVVGIFYFLCFECVDEYSGLYVFFKILKTLFAVGAFAFMATTFFSGYLEQMMVDGLQVSAPKVFVHALALFPLVFVLLRGTAYAFTLETLEETGLFVLTLLFPLICYGLSVVMLLISVIWAPVALLVLWLGIQIFIKGRLNGFERFLFNLLYYGAFAAIGFSFIERGNLLAVFAFVAMACCFFFFLAMDLCKDTTVGYWLFNVLGILTCGTFVVVGLVLAGTGNMPGLGKMFSCALPDARLYALYFAPLLYVVLRPPLYKLGAESDWEDGLTDVMISFLLPVLCYVIALLFLLIGLMIPLLVIAAIVLIVLITMALRDDYPCLPDTAMTIRESASPYIRSITIIERD